MHYDPHSLLIIDVSPFSRSLALLPTARALRAACPKAFISAAASKGTCELLTSAGLVDETIDLGLIKASDQGFGEAFKRLARLVRRARRDSYDLVLDLSPRLETQLVSRLTRGARTITPSRLTQVLDSLFSRGRGARPTDHLSDCRDVLKQLGIKPDDMQLSIDLPAEENARFENLLARNGSRGGEPVVVLYAAEVGGGRGWPIESFADLALRIANSFGARVIAVDEPAGRAFTDAISGLLPKGSIKLTSPRALELAAAIARASVVVTDDSALGQLALGLGAPLVEVGSSYQTASVLKSHRIVYGPSRARITADEVFDVVCEMLQENRSSLLFQR